MHIKDNFQWFGVAINLEILYTWTYLKTACSVSTLKVMKDIFVTDKLNI